jgi:hypothetical protein
MKNRTEYRKRSKDHVSVYFCIFILFLTSMELWIAWAGRDVYIDFFVGLCLSFLIKVNHIKLNMNQKNIFAFLFLFISVVFLKWSNITEKRIIGEVMGYLLPVSLIIFLNDKDRVKCLKYIVKWFAILMVPAIITYILCQTVGLPSLGTIQVNNNDIQADWYLLKENYFFCTMYTLKETARFNGPFNEPGHLGMMSAFLLFADGFKFYKKSTWIILLALFMTLSLSGYVLAFAGFLFSKYYNGKIKMKIMIPFLIFIVVGYLFSVYYNDGENIINEKIISRLEYDEERGIVGNNRVQEDVHLYFLSMLSDSYLLMFGYDYEKVHQWAYEGSRGTGMEMFIVRFGIVGFILSLSFYLVCFLYDRPKKAAALFLTFVFLTLLQRSYWYWASWLICYLYGFTLWTKKKQYRNNNLKE